MGQLFFKKALQAAVLAGTKTTTIRRWDRARLKSGGRAWAPGVGWLSIDLVERITLSTLTADDARADGFPSVTALRAVLKECYPDTRSDGKKWYRIRFRLRSAENPPSQ